MTSKLEVKFYMKSVWNTTCVCTNAFNTGNFRFCCVMVIALITVTDKSGVQVITAFSVCRHYS